MRELTNDEGKTVNTTSELTKTCEEYIRKNFSRNEDDDVPRTKAIDEKWWNTADEEHRKTGWSEKQHEEKIDKEIRERRNNSRLAKFLEERSEYRRFLESEISMREIKSAINSLKKRKTVGGDKIPAGISTNTIDWCAP
eukprot:GEMP01143873.1.p1 GENE.GEMP01143873.1~~GEMP01143873.1.p1  ORF type:complete len:139 (+),score=8.61 GEMP01143873.1:3-419(+)